MRKPQLRAILSLFYTSPYLNNGGCSSSLFIQRFRCSPKSSRLSLSHRLFTATAVLPPPEWIEPFADNSDVITHPQNYKTSIWVSRILSLLDESPDMESNLTDYCNKFFIKLTPNFVAFVLGSTETRPQPKVAFRFFVWAGKQKKYKHKLECYASLIDLLSVSGDVERIKVAFVEFKKLGFLIDVSAANLLIRSLGNSGMVEELLWVWRKMKENGNEPSLYTYNFLMNGLVNSMFIESAEQVFEVMENGKIKPDVVTYNTMIKGYCKAGKTTKAMEKLKEMEAGELEPDKITYMTLIQACYSEGDYDTCLALYQVMAERVSDVSRHAYSLVISGLCKDGKHVEAYAVFQDMARKGCRANVAIYTALVDSSVKIGNVAEAMSLFKRMKLEGFMPDTVTYGAIVNGLCKQGRLDEAMEYFKFCKENGIGVNAMFYSSIIDGLGKAGRVEESEELFKEMAIKGCSRDSYCYNALIDALAKCGRVDDALALFTEMGDEGCEQTVYTYTILMDGLFKKHRNEEALKYWNIMIDKGITPSAASFRVLSFGLCLSGKVARACKILDDLAPMGVIPENAFEDMINVLCKAGRVEQACKLADGIIDRGREIPGRVRTVLMNALRKAGNADMAVKLMHSKIGIGYVRHGSIKKRVKFQTLLHESKFMDGTMKLPGLNCKTNKRFSNEDDPEVIIRRFEEVAEKAGDVQTETLRHILDLNWGTEYLKRWLGNDINKDELDSAALESLYTSLVPLSSHADVETYIQRIADGDTSPLLTQQPITHLSLSSGTTDGRQKYVPFMRHSAQTTLQTFRIAAAYRSRAYPVKGGGKVLEFIYSSKQFKTKGGLKAGTATTHYFASKEFKIKQEKTKTFTCSPKEVISCGDYKQTTYCHLLLGLVYSKQVEFITSTFAYSILQALIAFEDLWREICIDITHGSLSDKITIPSVRESVLKLLSPNPCLGEEIRRKCEELEELNWVGMISKLWPNAKYLYSIMTGSMELYTKKLKHYAGDLPLVSADYGSTESWIGVNVDPSLPPERVSFTVVPTFSYFEFIPLHRRQTDGTSPSDPTEDFIEDEPVPLSKVKLGQEYEVVLTTFTGLYRYRLGDIVEVSGFHKGTPKLNFLCRRKLILTVNIDKNTEKDLQVVVEKGSQLLKSRSSSSAELVDFTSHADVARHPGHYVIYWEVKGDVGEDVIQECCREMDKAFMDHGYVVSRKTNSIGPLELRVVANGTFEKVLDLYLSNGAALSQFKTPRCTTNVELLKILNCYTVNRVYSTAYMG